jgi:hypothetical protein
MVIESVVESGERVLVTSRLEAPDTTSTRFCVFSFQGDQIIDMQDSNKPKEAKRLLSR